MEYIALYLNILISIFLLSLSKLHLNINIENFYFLNDEQIIIRIKGSGTQNILGNNFAESQNVIYKDQTILNSNSKQVNIESNNGEYTELRIVYGHKLTSCQYMFENIKTITFIDLSSFDTSEVLDMSYMFYGCHSLTSITLGVFDTRKVQNFASIFYECESLKELDVSKFDTSSANNMGSMFSDCFLLTSLDVSHFVTNNVEAMNSMFNNCSNLLSLNLSGFDTSKVTQFTSMFAHCKSLTSLNLSNFITSKGDLMERMFRNCVNLEYLNLDKATQSNGMYAAFDMILDGVPKNLVICIHTFQQITSQLSDLTYYANDCTENWRNSVKKKRVILDNSYVDQCSGTSPYEFENKCYQNCPDFTNDDNNDKICEKNIDKYIPTTHILYNEKMSTTYIDIEKQTKTEKNYVETDNEKTNKNIRTDKPDLSDKTDKQSNFYKIEKTFINEPVINTLNTICSARKFLLGECQINSNEDKNLVNKNIIDSILDGSLDDIFEKILQTGNKFKKVSEKETVHISILPEYINLNDTDNNDTIIDFGNCTSILREKHGLNDKEIFLLMIEHFYKEINIPLIEYYLFDQERETQLNLDYCNENTINNYYSVSIDESEEYKYNPYSDYYSDGCFPNAEEDGLDVTLYDRKEIYNDERAMCEKNCTYKDYNYVNKKVNCECRLKTEFVSFYNINFDKRKLLNTFTNVQKKSNIYVIQCQNLLFNKENLMTNIGSYLIIGIILISFICSISFCFRGFEALKFKINIVCFLEPSVVGKNVNKKSKNTKKSKTINQTFVIKNFEINKNKKKNNKHRIKVSNPIKHINLKSKNNNPKKYIKKAKSTNILTPIRKNKNIHSSTKNILNKNQIKNNLNTNKKNNGKNDKIKFELSGYEINNFNFENAVKFDNRSYCEYYISLINTKHLLVFTFCTSNDYNSKVIKITLFFYIFVLFYTTNAMFFNDSTMHEIFESKSNYNFIYQIPQIIYSSLISSAFKIVLSYLALTEANIIELKNIIKTEKLVKSQIKKNKELKKVFNNSERIKNLNKCIAIKSTLFFIFDFLSLAIFWFYISSFGAVFENTQLNLLEDTLISFGTSLIYPFFIYLLPGIFRIPSLRNKYNCLYKFSKILQLL
jgi:surface protein